MKPTAYASPQATFDGIVRADGRVATRNYIGILSTVNCSATVARGIADHFTRERLADFPNVDGVVALTHGSGCGMDTHGEGMKILRRTLAGYARHANMAGVLMIGLGCEANQISSLLGAEQLDRGSAAADVQHPGHGRHGEDHRARHRAREGDAAARQRGDAPAGAGVAHHRRAAMRRLRRLLGHHGEPGAGRGSRPARAPRRHGDPVGDARDLRRRASADAPRGVARGRREADRAHPLVGGLHRRARRAR